MESNMLSQIVAMLGSGPAVAAGGPQGGGDSAVIGSDGLVEASPAAPPSQSGGVADFLKKLFSGDQGGVGPDGLSQPPPFAPPMAAPPSGPKPQFGPPAPPPSVAGTVMGDAQPMPSGAVPDQIRKLLSGGGDAPRPAPVPYGGQMPTSAGIPRYDTTIQTPAKPDPSTVTGADVSRFIRSVMTGAASGDPKASKGAAIFQGAAGATQNSYAEQQREEQQKTAQAEKRWKRDLEVAKDMRADKADARAERKDAREEGRVASTDKLTAARTAYLVTKTMEKLSAELNPNQVIAVERLIRDNANYLARQGKSEKEILPELEKQRAEIVRRIKQKDVGAAAPQAVPDQTWGGKTYRLKPGGNPSNQSDWSPVQ